MTTQFLLSELGIISQEAKRKYPDLRTASDKALQDLKAITVTSEAQLAADVRRRPHITTPLITACKSKNAKLALPGIASLQRLLVTGAVSEELLPDVLDAFQEASSFGIDVQLKILQAIPSLLQNFNKVIHGQLQASVLQICASLQQTKTPAISRTASATIQQAISFVFEKVDLEDEQGDRSRLTEELQVDGRQVKISTAALDAYRVFQDVCFLTEGDAPQFITKASMSPVFGLELIESILTDHADIFESHPEQQHLLSARLVPLITRFLSERLPYSVTVRTVRILCILVREHLEMVHGAAEIALSLLNHSLDTDTAIPWRRALCMEALRLLCSDPDLILDLFTLYDKQEDRRNIVQETLANFVRLAAEKPSLIGVGQQSSFPASQAAQKASQEQAFVDAGNAAGIGGDFGVTEVNVPGISMQFSTMRVPCLEQVDKSEPPVIPETYIYSIVLTCVNNISEALAKVVLPLTLQRDKHKSRGKAEEGEDSSDDVKTKFRTKPVPLNPLDLEQHPSHQAVRTVVEFIDQCWPAILATSSTFLYAALDADFYRGLIRAIQKTTQVAGVLRLATPRDAFLTTLSKAAVPPNVYNKDTPLSGAVSPRLGASNAFQSTDAVTGDSSKSRNLSLDAGGPTLSQRNLMCLRALVNLAIALGPVLDDAWSIILDVVQRASVVLAISGTIATARDYRSGAGEVEAGGSQPSLSSEIAAVEAAVTRLFHSTSEYPNDAFLVLLKAVCDLVGERGTGSAPQTPSLEAPGPGHLQRRVSVMSNLSTSSVSAPQFDYFAIAKLGEIAKVNLQRLTLLDAEGGWPVLVDKLLLISGDAQQEATARLMSSDVLGSLTVESVAASSSEPEELRASIQSRSLATLKEMIGSLQRHDQEVVIEVHKTALDALGALLERCGDSIVAGWEHIFDIVYSVFENGSNPARDELESRTISARLAKSAFGSVQLICSDFLSAVPQASFDALIDLTTRFCAQSSDLNLSLTAVTLCWNISDYALSRIIENSGDAVPSTLTESWIKSQDRLVPITADSRSDVRNSVTHSLFRVLDTSAEKLPRTLWENCMRNTLFRLLDLNISLHTSVRNGDDAQAQSYTATSKVILQGTGQLWGDYLEEIISSPSFENLWQSLLDRLSQLLGVNSPELSTHCFAALSQILDHVGDSSRLSQRATNAIFDLWTHSKPQFQSPAKTRDAEKAMVAYVALQKQLKSHLSKSLTAAHVTSILDNLHHCIISSTPAPYSSDVESLTQLQQDTLQNLDSMQLEIKGVPEALVNTLEKFAVLPYTKSPSVHTSEELTYVAFAKASMNLLERIIVNHAQGDELSSATITKVIEALRQSVSQKYTWARQGKTPSLWRKATTSGCEILKTVCATSQKSRLHDQRLLLSIVRLAADVAAADLNSLPSNNSTLLEDETFDLEALSSTLTLVTPLLLDSQGPSSEALQRHLEALFSSSLVHPPSEDEPIIPNSSEQIPSLFSAVRRGRTTESTFNPRVRMCYATLDELFALSWKSNIAFPYLILRCAVPLKTYIADQPLRGRLPTPASERLELLYICAKIAQGEEKKKARLLEWLAPLLNQALGCVGDDEELAVQMREAVGLVLTGTMASLGALAVV